jgi:hypothetical protein
MSQAPAPEFVVTSYPGQKERCIPIPPAIYAHWERHRNLPPFIRLATPDEVYKTRNTMRMAVVDRRGLGTRDSG